jgi:glutathione synthase/RimK-type ligase-like ATP-grasp enzyme
LNLLLNVTPVNGAEAWADFERSEFGTVPTLRLRPLEFEPDLVRRDLYNLEIENVTDPALHTLFRAKRDEIARQIEALEDRDTSRFVYGSLQLYGGIAQPLASAAEDLLETQMTEAVLQDGYAIVQEFVDGGEDGDARIFPLEGEILEREGKLAALRRVPTGNDPRANTSAGGRSVPLEIGDVERGIVEAMGKKLVADGMYFVGIDVIGGKVVEINAESPGGMQSIERLYEIDVCPTVIEALERRTDSKS